MQPRALWGRQKAFSPSLSLSRSACCVRSDVCSVAPLTRSPSLSFSRLHNQRAAHPYARRLVRWCVYIQRRRARTLTFSLSLSPCLAPAAPCTVSIYNMLYYVCHRRWRRAAPVYDIYRHLYRECALGEREIMYERMGSVGVAAAAAPRRMYIRRLVAARVWMNGWMLGTSERNRDLDVYTTSRERSCGAKFQTVR